MKQPKHLAADFRAWSLSRPDEIILANRGQLSALFFSSRASGIASWWALFGTLALLIAGNVMQIVAYFDPNPGLRLIMLGAYLFALGLFILLGLLLLIIGPILRRVSRRAIQQRTLEAVRSGGTPQMDFALYLRPFLWDKKPGIFDMLGAIFVRFDGTGIRSVVERQFLILLSTFTDRLPLLSLGRQSASAEAGRLSVTDAQWRDELTSLADHAAIIFLVLGPGEGTSWEIERVLDTPQWRRKTVFVMPSRHMVPPKSDPQAGYESVRDIFTARNYALPEWHPLGGLILEQSDGRDPVVYLCDPDPVIAGAQADRVTHGLKEMLGAADFRAKTARKPSRNRILNFDWTLNPDAFLKASRTWIWAALLTAALVGTGTAIWVFGYLPNEAHMGHLVRFLYLHAPAAQFAVVAAYLIQVILAYRLRLSGGRKLLFAQFANAIAIAGAIFVLACLATGSIWSKPAWGVWMLWSDPKTIATLILLVALLGYGLAHRITLYRLPIVSFLYGTVPVLATVLVVYAGTFYGSIHQSQSGGLIWRPMHDFRQSFDGVRPMADVYIYPLAAAHLTALLLFGALVLSIVRWQVQNRRRQHLKSMVE